MLQPIADMRDRLKRDADDSEASGYPSTLLYLEFSLKLAVAAMVASIKTERERYRYRQEYNLVCADSLGNWVAASDEMLAGPTSQYLHSEARAAQRELTQKVGADSWQYKSVSLLHEALRLIDGTADPIATTIQGRLWLSMASRFRNESLRGHGVDTVAQMLKVQPLLKKSVDLFVQNFDLFKHEWAFLHKNLSGKYLIRPLGNTYDNFAHLKAKSDIALDDGVYIGFSPDCLCKVDLVHADADLRDFLIANGAFNGKRFQVVSYISGNKEEVDADAFLTPASELPRSETHGKIDLDIKGRTFTNVPDRFSDYVHRSKLETDLEEALKRERHPIVSLVGRGGIGKTSIALSVLERLCQAGPYFATIWFSARDIDLLESGPKPVKPAVLTAVDVAKDFLRFLGLHEGTIKPQEAVARFATELCESSSGALLLVFDNFETFENPRDLFNFLDASVRPPNKILITSRERRDFNGDYSITVGGMDDSEAGRLVELTSRRFGVEAVISDSFKSDLIKESGGHPYVIKVLLGSVARGGSTTKVERILASEERLLSALFERTFATLSPSAKRIFLTLCSWRSSVFRLHLEAVLRRPENEYIDLAGIDELLLSSFVEAELQDGEELLIVPLAAQVFGRQKLRFSPFKHAAELDAKILMNFGVVQRTGVNEFDKRTLAFVSAIAKSGDADLVKEIEYVASKYVRALLYLSTYYEEQGNLRASRDYATRFIERSISKNDLVIGWQRVARLSALLKERLDEVHALAELSILDILPFVELSNSANRLNKIFRENPNLTDTEEKKAIVSQVADVMQARIMEGDATDRSRLSWLYRQLGDRRAAFEVARIGLVMDPANPYCKAIVAAGL